MPQYRRGEPAWKPQMFDAVCAKCHKRCEVPFKPIPNKPVYCSDCYNREGAQKRPAQATDKLDQISQKLDKILRAMGLD